MNISPTLEQMQEAGFPMGGEPLTALDLVDTVMTAVQPAGDLMGDEARARRWWALESMRLPDGPLPEDAAAMRLRAALRELFDGHLEGRDAKPAAVTDLNAFAAAVPTSEQLEVRSGIPETSLRWHTEHGGNAILAAIAREAIALFGDPAELAKLRRCANETCSMLFIAENKRRMWCSSAGCGNRVRAARHYRKTRAEAEPQ